MNWLLPPGNSTFAADIDFLYYLILVITGIAFVVVEGGILWFAVKYRSRPGRKATYTHGSMKAEIIWTAVPAVTLVVIGIMSGGVWSEVKGRNAAPPGSMVVGVTAKQFEWNVTYPGADGQIGTSDDFQTRNQLHIPVDQPIVVKLATEDVIHSFFIPTMRVKQDALPGQVIDVWFQSTATGEFDIACAELCGNLHTTMSGRLFVHSAADFAQWNQDRIAAAAAGDR